MTRRIVLHIGRLVLRGVAPQDAAGLSAAVQAELQRRLSHPGSATALVGAGNCDRLPAGEVRITQARSARAIGRATGQVITASLLNRGRR